MKKYFGIATLTLISACSMNPPQPAEPAFAPVRPIVAEPPPIENGSIYQSGYGMALFSDVSAKRVGDVITVILQENTAAKKSSSTKTKKDSSVNMTVPTIFGGPVTSGGLDLLSAQLDTKRTFDGAGDAAQSNSLTGRITVTVSEVLGNGHLIVQGEKRLTLNQGGESIRFSGIVRPADIRSDNTVNSASVANAQIIYSGTGAIADANTAGWATRIFSSAWWPF